MFRKLLSRSEWRVIHKSFLSEVPLTSVRCLATKPSANSGTFKGTLQWQEALDGIHEYNKKGLGQASSTAQYNKTVDRYENIMLSLNYNGPDQLVNALNSLFGDRKSTVKVVDVGAGSGLAGQEIFDAGYRNIDAVDASEGLLGIAKRKGFYGNVHLCTIGTDKIPIPDDTYDVCTICGAMIENHIPMEGIRDITRIVKPGGYIINVFREEAMRYPWYKEALGPFFNQLEIEGVWEEVGREIHPQFFAGLDGILFIHKVL